MEDFVSFEIAKKLKEKGFVEKCLTYYDVEDNVGVLFNTQYTDDISPCQYTDWGAWLSKNPIPTPTNPGAEDE